MRNEGRTFILATNRGDAIAWCHRNGRNPYAKSTIILTTARACRGHEFREHDEAVNLGWSRELADEWQYVIAAYGKEHPWIGDDQEEQG